jgi:hypothetical protein
MTSVLRRPGSKLGRILARAADPATTTNQQLYSKLVSAVAELFSRSSAGLVRQLTGPGAVLPTGAVEDLGIAWLSNNTVQVAAGRARSDDDTFNIVLAGAVTADIANVGVVNGLDAGVEAADTWYAIWVIADSTGVAPAGSLLSASFTAPTLPAGYNKKRRIGAVRNTGTAFARFFQRGTGRTRRTTFDRIPVVQLNNGSALAFTVVSLAAGVPPTSRNVIVDWRFLNGAAGAVADVLSVRPAGATSADGPHRLRRGFGTSAQVFRCTTQMPTSAAQEVEYMVTQAANQATLAVLAYDDEL